MNLSGISCKIIFGYPFFISFILSSKIILPLTSTMQLFLFRFVRRILHHVPQAALSAGTLQGDVPTSLPPPSKAKDNCQTHFPVHCSCLFRNILSLLIPLQYHNPSLYNSTAHGQSGTSQTLQKYRQASGLCPPYLHGQ